MSPRATSTSSASRTVTHSRAALPSAAVVPSTLIRSIAQLRTAPCVPATSASLAYYDAYRSARLPANLLQAQRDFFGAHTY